MLRGRGKILAIVAALTFLTGAGLGAAYLYDPPAWGPGGRLNSYLWVMLSIPAMVGMLAFLSWLIDIRRGGEPMAAVAWMTAVLTVVVLAFYATTTKARNYGGSTQGLRWLFWLIPFWLLLLPRGVAAGQHRGWVRKLSLLALLFSILSVGYAMRNPWSHPWVQDALEPAPPRADRLHDKLVLPVSSYVSTRTPEPTGMLKLRLAISCQLQLASIAVPSPRP